MGVIQRQGIKNTISGYAGILIGFVNLMVIQPFFLTKEELGLTRILYSFAFLIATLIPFGITNATIRFFPLFKNEKEKHHGYFGFMNIFPLIGFVLATLFVLLLKHFIMNQFRTQSPMFLDYFNYIFPLMFFCSFITVLSVYCNTNFKSTIPSFLNDVIVKLFTIIVVSLYFLKVVDRDGFILLYVSVYGIQLVVLLGYIFYFDKPGFKIDWAFLKEKKIASLIRYGLLLWFAGLSSIGLKYFDTIMVGKYMPLAFVGIYSIAAFIPTIIEAPANALERIGSAKIAFAWSNNDLSQIGEIYRKSSLYMLLVGALMFLNITVNIHTVLSFLPDGYQQGESVVMIIATGTLFNMATGLNVPILFNSHKYKAGAILLILLAVFVLFLQMIFIPVFGLNGAAMATSVAAFLYNFFLFYLVYRYFKLQPFTGKNLTVFILTTSVFVSSLFLPHFDNKVVDLVIRTGIVSTIFLAAVYLFKIIPEFHMYLPWERKK